MSKKSAHGDLIAHVNVEIEGSWPLNLKSLIGGEY